MRRRQLLALAILAALSTPGAFAFHGRTQGANRESAGWPVASFALVDHYGKRFTEAHLKGYWTFVLLGDTRCGARCDAALTALAAMRRRLANADAIRTTQVVFVSLDPERDTPEILRRHIASFDVRFVGATGPRAILRRLMDELDVSDPGSLVLIGPDLVLRSELLPPYDPLLLTAEYLRTRSRR